MAIYEQTLVDELGDVADDIRGTIYPDIGTRPYHVWLVRTRWTGGDRGEGEEVPISEREIVPTPRLSTGVDSLDRMLHAAGAIDDGSMALTEISLRYTEADLNPVCGEDEQFFIEVRDIHPDSPRRRFTPASAPYRDTRAIGWTVRLRSQVMARDDSGRPWR